MKAGELLGWVCECSDAEGLPAGRAGPSAITCFRHTIVQNKEQGCIFIGMEGVSE